MSSSTIAVGIVGLPNVGKSTLFNALLKQQVALAANYPFATIEPNVGIAQVPDPRLAVLASIVKTEVIKPATVEFVDIAGLVKGASKGEGLGNQFLSHIRETATICHVLRSFSDPDIIREGAVNPLSDLETIRTELMLADLSTLAKQPQPKGSVPPEAKDRWEIIQFFKKNLDAGTQLSWTSLSPEQQAIAKELCLLSTKPEIFTINVDESSISTAAELTTQFAKELQVKPTQIVIISAKIESELSVLSIEDQQAYLQDLGIEKSGLERLAETAYQTLGLQSFLTAGEKEVRAWTIRKGMTAQEAAGVIHTDFSKKFIKALIASYADFVEYGGWKGVKEQGKMRQEGRDYLMQDGDIVEFAIGA